MAAAGCSSSRGCAKDATKWSAAASFAAHKTRPHKAVSFASNRGRLRAAFCRHRQECLCHKKLMKIEVCKHRQECLCHKKLSFLNHKKLLALCHKNFFLCPKNLFLEPLKTSCLCHRKSFGTSSRKTPLP